MVVYYDVIMGGHAFNASGIGYLHTKQICLAWFHKLGNLGLFPWQRVCLSAHPARRALLTVP